MESTRRYRGRFAPSPTGPLHLGSLTAALGSWIRARQAGGAWLVRIEDIDPPREAPGAAALQLATLAAFGLVPDEPVVHQSRRGALYARALDRLLRDGAAFECRCSRSELAAVGGVHRACRVPPSDPARTPSIRVRACTTPITVDDRVFGPQTQVLADAVGDIVVRRADGLWAYQLAVVVDDAEQAISEVVRGADLLDSTPRQVWLQRLLDLPTPAYLHLPLVRDAGGHKLSKSEGAAALDPHDPLPDLRRALEALAIPPGATAAARSIPELLALGVRAFDPARLACRAATCNCHGDCA